MKNLLLLSLLILPGCALFNPAGVADYELTLGEYEAQIFNSKDIESITFEMTKNPDGTVTAVFNQKGVSASNPAMIQAENNSKVLDLAAKLIDPE